MGLCDKCIDIRVHENVAELGQFSSQSFPFMFFGTSDPRISDGVDTAAPSVHQCEESQAPVVSLGQKCQVVGWSSQSVQVLFFSSQCVVGETHGFGSFHR